MGTIHSTPDSTTIQTLLDLALQSAQFTDNLITSMPPCANGSGLNHATSVCLTSPPPLLLVEVSLNTEPAVIPCAELTIKGTNKVEHYTLVAVIYLGGFHFTARMVDCEGTIWSYDGRQNNGSPWFDNKCGSVRNETDLAALPMFQGHPAHLYIYTCIA